MKILQMAKIVIIDVRTNGIDGESTEYFCTECLQLRLSFHPDKYRCFNCGTREIITGAVGSLDKPALLKKYKE